MAEISKPDYTYLWSSGGSIVAPSNVKIQTGWTAEVPPFQWENWSQNRQDQAIAHVLQHGISVWDDVTEYQAGKSYVQGSDGLLYKARTTHTNVNPVTDTSFVNWTKAMSGGLLNVQTFTSNGTYTPTPGMSFVIIKVQGGGGGGGGTTAPTAGLVSIGAGGAAGAYAVGRFSAALIGASQPVTLGGGGLAAVSNDGGVGGTSSVGSLITAPGGPGGPMFNNAGVPNANGNGVTSGSPTGGNIVSSVGVGGGLALGLTTLVCYGGQGGASIFGAGATNSPSGGSGGNPGFGYGSGGSGAATISGGGALPGGVGKGGIVIIEEYA